MAINRILRVGPATGAEMEHTKDTDTTDSTDTEEVDVDVDVEA